MTIELIIAYSDTFIFMYLLYTKKSTNPLSLLFSSMNIISSSLWITYSDMKSDMPLLIRGSADLVLFTNSYILSNRLKKIQINQNCWYKN